MEDESEETEVKSKQELIEKWESAIEAAGFYGKGKEERLISYMKDFVSDLKQLDEQEGLEAKTQELIEVYKREDGAYSNPENGWIGGFIEDLENLVEAEQKYYVLNGEGETMIRKSDSRVRTSSGFKIINGLKNENYKFTEQEIKDYDKRYWPFRRKVEELEE